MRYLLTTLVWLGSLSFALAQSVSVYPESMPLGQPVPSTGLSESLPNLIQTQMANAPAMMVGTPSWGAISSNLHTGNCAPEVNCAPLNCEPRTRLLQSSGWNRPVIAQRWHGECQPERGSLLARIKAWLFYHPGPAVHPTLVTTPYQASMRAYFPINREPLSMSGNCATGACGTTTPMVARPRLFGQGPVVSMQSACASPMSMPRTQLFASTANCGQPRRSGVLRRMLDFFTPSGFGLSGGCEYSSVPTSMGYGPTETGCSTCGTVQGAMMTNHGLPGYRFANALTTPIQQPVISTMPMMSTLPGTQLAVPTSETVIPSNR